MDEPTIDYLGVITQLQFENEGLRHQLNTIRQIEIELPDFSEISRYLTRPQSMVLVITGIYLLSVFVDVLIKLRFRRDMQ